MEILIIALEIIVAFGIVILFHELGHFALAKINGVAVPEFALGMGPEIIGINYHGTRYKLCLFPIGGYVKMIGEDDNEGLENSVPRSRNFRYKHPLQKISIIFAGPFMNYILAILMFAAVSFFWGIDNPVKVPLDITSSNVIVDFVDPRKPAGAAGLKPGDTILAVNGNTITQPKDFTDIIHKSSGRKVNLTIKHKGQIRNLTVTPKMNTVEKHGQIGVVLGTPIPRRIDSIQKGSLASAAGLRKGDIILDFDGESFTGSTYNMYTPTTTITYYREKSGTRKTITLDGAPGKNTGITLTPLVKKISLPSALARGARQSVDTVTATAYSLYLVFTAKVSGDDVAGPVGIVQYASTFAKRGLRDLILFFAFISVSLGVINLFPFPALDGSRIVFHIWEAIIGKALDPRKEGIIHYVGFCILMAMIALFTYRDISLLIKPHLHDILSTLSQKI